MESFLCHKLRLLSYVASSYYCTLVSVHFLLLFTNSRAQTTAVPATYVFGDSLVDVGNNKYLPLSLLRADLPYNGVDYPGGKPTGRFSNGKNAADFIAEKLGIRTAPPYLARRDGLVYVNGVSFASGGAGILNTTNENVIDQTIPLLAQVGDFSSVRRRLENEMGYAKVQEHLSKSLFPIVVGSNDIIRYFSNGSKQSKEHTPQQYITLMITTLEELLKGIYGLGARKFLVIGLPPIGCAPKQRFEAAKEECNEEVNLWTRNYNEELKQMMPNLKAHLKEFQYTYFDTYSVLVELIQNPATYGFNETKGACCGAGKLRAELPCTPVSVLCSNRNAHVFWDIYHPTEAAASTAINMLFIGSGQYVSPISVQDLIAL